MPFSRVWGQSRGVVVSQWTITMPHWSQALISCCFISIGVHTAEMYSCSNMYQLPSARIEVSACSTNPHDQLFLTGRWDLWDSDAFQAAQKPRVAPINHGWSNLRCVWVGWPLDGCAAVSAHMQMLLYTGGFGSREVLRQLRWWLGLLCSQLVWSKKHLVLLKSAAGLGVIIMCWAGGFVNRRVIAERSPPSCSRLFLSLGLGGHGASQPAGAGGCNRELLGLPVAVPQR